MECIQQLTMRGAIVSINKLEKIIHMQTRIIH